MNARRPWVTAPTGSMIPTEPAEWINWFVASADPERLTEFVGQAVDTATTGVPEIACDPALRSDLLAMASDSLNSFLELLATGGSESAHIPSAGVAFARTLARRGLDVAVLLKVYRLGQSFFWHVTMDESERFIADPGLRNRVLTLMWERLNLWLEFLLDELSSAYDEERRRWLQGASARRSETVRTIVAGGEVDSDRASRQLGFELRRCHIAMILWADAAAPQEEVIGRLERVAQTAARALGSSLALTVPAGSREIYAWIGLVDALDAHEVGHALPITGHDRVAIGRSGRDVIGFRQSHLEALAARRIGLADPRRPACTRYDDVEVVSLLSHDERAMRALIAHELGGLAADGPGLDALRATALTYLRSGSASAAARELGTHKNTIRHRIERIEQLLGHPIDEHRLQLQLALMLAEVFGTT
ncbi:helix-turn-helix domain-containing protein [Mycobacterium sp.]|uniref:PucR family transcriptional regulator n=1 Tax=Mycobacterium sp. TaxID=1785 RepID=UPI0025E6CE28|nr:helix-turn-helix domain-containing protein [Mycobacterium sp.]